MVLMAYINLVFGNLREYIENLRMHLTNGGLRNNDLEIRINEGDRVHIARSAYIHWAIKIDNDDYMHYSMSPVVPCWVQFVFSPFLFTLSPFFEIQRTTKNVLSFSGDIICDNTLDEHFRATIDVTEITERARQEENRRFYNVMLNNCEHFVNRCRYGFSVWDFWSCDQWNLIFVFIYGLFYLRQIAVYKDDSFIIVLLNIFFSVLSYRFSFLMSQISILAILAYDWSFFTLYSCFVLSFYLFWLQHSRRVCSFMYSINNWYLKILARFIIVIPNIKPYVHLLMLLFHYFSFPTALNVVVYFIIVTIIITF